MYLTKEQLKQLRLIVVRLVDLATLEQIVDDLDSRIDSTAPSLELKTASVLREANLKGWIAELIEEVRSRFANDPELKAFLTTLTDPGVVVTAADEYSACYTDNRPFVNRKELRATLKSIAGDQGPRILMVHGGRETGKSYTGNLIKHLSSTIGFEVVDVDLIDFAILTPYEIAVSIASQMTLPKPRERGEEQWSRWIFHYFNDFVGQMRDSEKTWWIIIDSFESISVAQEINDFVEQLSMRVNKVPMKVRVILISYQSDLPPQVDPIVARDQTGKIDVEDLSAFFVQFYSERKPLIDAADRTKRAAENVKEVWEAAEKSTGSHHTVIGKELLTVCKRILQEVP